MLPTVEYILRWYQIAALMLVQAGHEIGSHSFQHLNGWKRSQLAVCRDITGGFVGISAFGLTSLFRPPREESP